MCSIWVVLLAVLGMLTIILFVVHIGVSIHMLFDRVSGVEESIRRLMKDRVFGDVVDNRFKRVWTELDELKDAKRKKKV